MTIKWCVNIVESERGWGQRIDEQKLFDTEQEAMSFVDAYNAKYNNKPTVPDWYMFAQQPFKTKD